MAHAQKSTAPFTITGIIRNAQTAKPVEYATVNVLDSADKTVSAAYSLENGSFATRVGKAGSYVLELVFIGYKTQKIPLLVKEEHALLNIGVITMEPGADTLAAVTITSRKRLIEQKPGMLIYNAENDMANKGGTAADVLRKAPVLNVDAQGNVSMRGSGNLKILINGKYSGQMARNAADALNMMPANMIKSVEVITTPAAKYDAEGAAGVINIITKKGRNNMSGSLEAAVSNLEQVLNPRFSLSKQKWQVNFSGHLHRLRRKSAQIVNRDAIANDEVTQRLHQVIEKDNTAPHGSADLAIDYMLNESSELSLGVNSWFGKWPENNHTRTVTTNPDGTIREQYMQDITQSGSYLGMDINLAYNKRFKRQGQQLTLLAQRSPARDLSEYDARQTTAVKELLYRELNNSTTRNSEWTFQADYVQPLDAKGTLNLESGAKGILRSVGNRYDVEASDAAQVDKLVAQPDRSDYFKYSQDVVAGYTMLKADLQKGWYVEAGARLEATWVKGRLQNTGTAFNNNFLNLVPTATLTRKLNESNTFNLSYTRRLTRPYIWDLNPNVNASDPKNLESGNPQLKPEMAHQAEFSYNANIRKTVFVNTALFWKQTDNAIVELTETDAAGISLTSKQNLAANKQYGMNLSVTATLSSKWTANGNVNVSYTNFTSRPMGIYHKGWGTDINLNTSYKLPRDFSVQTFGEYNTRSVTLLGSRGRRYYYSFSGKKEFKKAKMSVTVAAVNPFSAYIAQTELKERPTFSSVVDNRYYNRSFKITVGWEFGGAQKQRAERKKIENNDIKVQGKG